MMDAYPSFNSAESLYEDLRFAKIHANAIDRIAVVGEGTWQETWVALFGLFGGLNMAFFKRSEGEQAKNWLLAPG